MMGHIMSVFTLTATLTIYYYNEIILSIICNINQLTISLLYFTLKKYASFQKYRHYIHIHTYCISGDELTISTSFKNCDVLFSWDNLKKTYYHVRINNQPWKRVYEPKYTVKDALLRSDSIRINIRAEHSSKDNTLIYNGELCMVLALHCT